MSPAFLLFLAMAQVGWAPPAFLDGRLPGEHFVILFRERHRPLAEELKVSAENTRARIVSDLGAPGSEGGTSVCLLQDFDDMQAAAPRGMSIPIWASGLAFPAYNLIFLRLVSPSASDVDLDKLFAHELAHLALAHALGPVTIPRWFNEGFAMYQSDEWSFERTRILASGVISNRIFSLEALTDAFPEKVADIRLAYAQSIDFVSFLLEKKGRAGFGRLIRLLAGGLGFLAALEEAYDTSLASLEDEWHTDLRLRFTWIPLLTGTASLWFIVSLVFILAYIRRRRRWRRELERLAAEDLSSCPWPWPPGDLE
ncbi:MAG TPA: peptidase MA family metallohydrolase [Myxococcota bacterium]|nr:peptidase MA family metallohydrolase [Myxococcota bacterium]